MPSLQLSWVAEGFLVRVVFRLILHLVWQAFPNSHLQTRAFFRWSCLLLVLLSGMLVWNLLMVTWHLSRVGDSSRAVLRSVNSDLSPL